MKTLVINQDSQTQRMAFQENQLTSLEIEFQRVPSYVLAGTDDPVYKKHFDTWQRPLSVTEVSCFLSHKNAWEIVSSSDQPMLILEDDAWLDIKTRGVLKELSDMNGIDYITLEVTGSNGKKLVSKKPEKIIFGTKLLRLYQGRSGAGGYILWPSGAKKLLRLTSNNQIGLADKFICSCYELNAYQIEPGLIIQLDQCVYHGITPPLQVTTTITTRTEQKLKFTHKVRYKLRRIVGEAKVGINLLIHQFNTERRHIILSDNFKNST